MKKLLASAAAVSPSLALMSDAPWFYNKNRPLVIGHRGSLG